MRPHTGATAQPHASFDSVILAAVVHECQPLLGARVQRVHPVAPDSLALVLRGRGPVRTLVASVHARWGRLCLTARATPSEPSTFALLARSRLEGATLCALEALPFERVVTCRFDTLEGPHELIVEIIGRRGNLIICEEGKIVGAARLVDGHAHDRVVLPQHPYVPPSRPLPDPLSVTAEVLAGVARDARLTAAWRAVLQAVGGIGPALAWEACVLAGIEPTRPLAGDAADRVVASLQAFGAAVRERRFTPVLYRDDHGVPVAYAAFPLRCYAGLHAEPAAMSEAVEAVVADLADAARLDRWRLDLAGTVRHAVSRARRALTAVDDDLRAAQDADRLRERGELIFAYLSQIPRGAGEIEVPGFDGAPARIALDPARSGVENAQAYFKRYARAAAARRRLPERRVELESDLAFLEGAASAIEQAECDDDLWEIEQDLVAAGLRRRASPTRRPAAADRGRTFAVEGLLVRVGRSARENDHLTFKVAGPDDLWLHARGMPGAHVILATHHASPAEAVITTAAGIAAYYSAGRGAARVPVDVTLRRFVRRARGGRPGQVHYTNERTLSVTPGLPGGRA